MTEATNPTVKNESAVERTRIPMSVPRRKLETSEIKGYHQYWFLHQNVPMAQQAGYEFVGSEEVTLNQQGVATDRAIDGNASLGTRVEIVAGGGDNLVLMKIKDEWYDADRKAIEERNADILNSIFRDEKVMGSERQSVDDQSKTYVRESLFNKAPHKRGK